MNGILLIDKPKGWTSFDVVAKVRGAVKAETGLKRPKVGHAGTLDPLATGLLIILVGDYCKRASEYSKLDKTYEVELKLGETSTTDDAEGEITTVSDRKPSNEELDQAIDSFTGEISQTPPIFSAIKVDGQRAYKLARAGQTPEMKARLVTIHSISDIKYDYPKVTFTTEVSSGTYIRSLVRDIGEKLGTGAYMAELRRTKIADYTVSEVVTPPQITSENIDKVLTKLI
jgi:tRNA pseudouridine55 synthase